MDIILIIVCGSLCGRRLPQTIMKMRPNCDRLFEEHGQISYQHTFTYIYHDIKAIGMPEKTSLGKGLGSN